MEKILKTFVLLVAILGLVKISNCGDYDNDEAFDAEYEYLDVLFPKLEPVADQEYDPVENAFIRPAQGCDLGEKCIVYYNCADSNNDASWLIDERMDSHGAESVTPNQPCPSLEKCCKKKIENPFPHVPATTRPTRSTSTTTTTTTATPSTTIKPLPKTSPTTTRTTTTATTRKPRPTRPRDPSYSLFEKYCKKPPSTLKCGTRNVRGLGGFTKSMQGKTNYAQYGEFPWTVALVHIDFNKKLQGGGSLIHPKVVLTAYHVLYGNYRKVMVRAGEWDTKSDKEICPTQDRLIERVLRHEDYDPVTRVNNVALLLLKKEFNLNSAVNTVCLPPAFEPEYIRNDCWSGGWGKDKFGAAGVYQEYLKKVKMPLYDHEFCEKKLNSSGMMNEGWRLHENLMCAGGKIGQDTCKGDGGSPLVCTTYEHTENYFVAGIVDSGLMCEEGHPGIYSDVSKYRKWIDEKFRLEGLRTFHYEI